MDETEWPPIHAFLRHLRSWATSMAPTPQRSHLPYHKSSITSFQRLFDGAIFHCEDKQASSLRIFCPCLYYQAIETTFMDTSIFEPVNQEPSTIVDTLTAKLHRQYGKSYPWATGKGRQLPAGHILAKKRKHSKVAVPSYPSWIPLSGLCSTSWLE